MFQLNTDGFTLEGRITHQENTSYAYDYNKWVNRALYIDNTLYTISNTRMKLNSLDTLALIAEISLG